MSSDEPLSDTDEESTFSDSNLTKLKPYDFEPLASSSSSSLSSGENSDTNPDISGSSRVGSTAWCQCEKCETMLADVECLCCIEANQIPDDFFEGNYYFSIFVYIYLKQETYAT